MTKSNRRLILFVFCAIIFVLGFHIGGFQLALLRAVNELGFDEAMIGLPIAVQFISISIMPLFFCPVADRVGKKKVAAIFMLIFIAGSLITGFYGTATLFLVGLFVIGAGYSVTECLITAVISDVFEEKTEKYVNLTQSFFCIGAVAGPLFLQALMYNFGVSWRATFIVCAIMAGIILPLFLFAMPPLPKKKETASSTSANPSEIKAPSKETGKSQNKNPGVSSPLKTNRVLLIGLVACMAAYVGVESAIAYFADTVLALELGAAALGAYAISLFWATMGIGRFIFGRMKNIPRHATPISLFLVAFSMLGIALIRQDIAMLVIFAAAGLACSCIWPGIVSPAVALNTNASGSIMSYLNLGAGIGGALIPFLLGIVMDITGFTTAFLIFTTLPILAGLFTLRSTMK